MECNLGHNVGHVERVIRIALGLTLLAVGGLTALPAWGTLLILIIGIVALVTGIMGYCPAWRLLGMNTCHHDHANNVLKWRDWVARSMSLLMRIENLMWSKRGGKRE